MANPIASLSNLQQRVIVAVLGIALFMGMLFSGTEATFGLFAIILALSLYEFYSLSPFKTPFSWKLLGLLTGLLIFCVLILNSVGDEAVPSRMLFFIPPILFIPLVFSKSTQPFQMIAWLVLGWFYLITPWICMLLIPMELEYSPQVFLGLFGLLWMADSGAYFAGKNLGKTKLLPRVSPKKSWEGLGGGLLASLILAYVLGEYQIGFSQNQWLVLAVSTTIFGTLGDLAESALKRSLDLKDSGTILPGHGGILDRFDGLFIAAPVNLLIVTFLF
ncbi:MAG TPA: phosphatidate cytidylyltransferase [Catalimonadaceae bacterium]|nr:phosphatidate cytidylyltransferase [Catalimonadaceae bacterium]